MIDLFHLIFYSEIMEKYDVAIIGAGPAGLTAGLYTVRARLKTICIEKLLSGGQMNNTELIENYTGFESILGRDLSAKMEAHAKKFGLAIKQDDVNKINHENKYHIIELASGEKIMTKSVIIASGGFPKRLNVQGEKEFWGKGVSYCAVCDGAFFKNVPIAVVGGGDSACEEGVFLTKFASKIYLIHRRDSFRASPFYQEEVFKNPKITVIWDSVPIEILGQNDVNGLIYKNIKTQKTNKLDIKGVFIFIGFEPNNSFIKNNIKLDQVGFFTTDQNYMTNIPGIFAIGDARSNSVKQIACAVGEGAAIGVIIDKYLKQNFSS
jgi:thioredoxin reductase (NADPH)